MSPELKVLIYFVRDGEIIPGNYEVQVNKQLKHNVILSVKFKTLKAGSSADISIKAEPDT